MLSLKVFFFPLALLQGRGYLDNVNLVSAQKGPGAPAGWVEKCSCPAGYEGEFCERCAPGYKKHFSDNGPLSSCEPCACQAGSCDPQTGKKSKGQGIAVPLSTICCLKN